MGTVPLQMIEFYLILSAVKPDLGSGMFYRLLVGTVTMLLFGYLGESLVINPWLGFIVGYLTGAVSDPPLNLIYNLADFVNKIWFCLAIWGAAKTETRLAMANNALRNPLL